MSETLTCKQCGNDFDVETRKDDMGTAKRFCSYLCHNKFYREQKKAEKLAGLNGTSENPVANGTGKEGLPFAQASPISKPLLSMKELPSKANALSFSGFDPAAQFIIATLQDENNNLKTERRELTGKVETLSKELADEKTARREDVLKKPSTLEGLSESPVIAQLMPHIGPALGQILTKLLGTGSVGIPGVNGATNGQNLPEETDKMVSALVGWFIGLPVELQTVFFNMVRGLAEKSPEEQVKLLEQLSNLVLNNSSFKQDYYAA